MKFAGVVIILQLLLVILFSSLSIFHGFIFSIVLIAIFCGVSAIFYPYINPMNLRHLILILAPIYMAYIFYWLPVWDEPSKGEYHAWQFVFIIPAVVLGLIVSVIVYLLRIKTLRGK